MTRDCFRHSTPIQEEFEASILCSARRPETVSTTTDATGPAPWHPLVSTAASYLTLPAVSPPTRRFSMSMNSTTTGMIATIETPKT